MAIGLPEASLWPANYLTPGEDVQSPPLESEKVWNRDFCLTQIVLIFIAFEHDIN